VVVKVGASVVCALYSRTTALSTFETRNYHLEENVNLLFFAQSVPLAIALATDMSLLCAEMFLFLSTRSPVEKLAIEKTARGLFNSCELKRVSKGSGTNEISISDYPTMTPPSRISNSA